MKKNIPAGNEEKRKFWEEQLQEWKSSGLSQADYCRRQGLSIKSFGYWKRRLSAGNLSLSLVEVRAFHAVCSPSKPLKLEVGGRFGIEIDRDFDAETLHRLLKVLER